MTKPPGRKLTAAQQFVNLQTNPICSGDGELFPTRLVWRYQTSPSPLGRRYDLRVEFKQGSVPEVFVEGPDLHALTDGRDLPHVYDQDRQRLCLFMPGTGEWRPWLRIDQTLVPWASLWLFYFEDWLVTDDWKGGGAHPEAASGNRHQRRALRARTGYRAQEETSR